MQTYNTTKKNLAKILAASDKDHKIEMQALFSEIARIKRLYVKSHGAPPQVPAVPRTAT